MRSPILQAILRVAKANPEIRELLKQEIHKKGSRIQYVPAEFRDTKPLVPPGTDLEIWMYEAQGVPYGIAFAGKSEKPLWHYRFKSDQARQKRINDTILDRKQIAEIRQKRKEQALKDRTKFRGELKVGDILYTSWGYDQTNVEFYEILEISGTRVVIREVAKRVAKSEVGADYVVPVPGQFIGPPLKKMIGQSAVKIDSSARAYKWDGKPKYQTGWGYGH